MANMPFVPNASIFAIMADWLSAYAPFVSDRFWAKVKRDSVLDAAHFDSIHGDDNQQHEAFRTLIVELWSVVGGCLAPAMVEELEYHTKNSITHMEVAQASQLEPWEEEEVWQQWERLDAMQAEQDKYDLYYNEY